MPIILIDLITIYDDVEGSEASHMTLVPITQEDKLGETSAPASDDLVPKHQEGSLGARTTLNTAFLNQLETQSSRETQPHDDNSENYMDTGEQEEGMGQP
jgi:hypothetical protein